MPHSTSGIGDAVITFSLTARFSTRPRTATTDRTAASPRPFPTKRTLPRVWRWTMKSSITVALISPSGRAPKYGTKWWRTADA